MTKAEKEKFAALETQNADLQNENDRLRSTTGVKSEVEKAEVETRRAIERANKLQVENTDLQTENESLKMKLQKATADKETLRVQ